MTFLTERTIPYKTYIKRALVQGLRQTFSEHPDELLQRTKVTLEYPRTEADYPAVVVKFYERQIANMGVSHVQKFKLYDPPVPTQTTADDGTLDDRWYEYRVAYVFDDDSESEASDPLRIANTSATAKYTLSWPAVTEIANYRIYRRSARSPIHVFQDVPVGTTTLVDDGSVAGTALSPLATRLWKHYTWSGDIEFAVYTLSNLDRDLVADSLVQTVTMGDLEAFTNLFYSRINPIDSSTTEAFPGSSSNFVVLQSNKMVGYGESQSPVPWQSEDDLIYQTSYRVGAYGEFYNLPSPPIPFIEAVDTFPYTPGVDELPTGNPSDPGLWPGKPQSQADIDAELEDNPPML